MGRHPRPEPLIRRLAAALLLAAGVAAAAEARAQAVTPPAPGDEEQAFVEALRRSDPATYETFIALRAARDRDLAEVVRLQQALRTAGPELRPLVLPQLRAARKRYAASAIAVLDFADERDRRALREYEETVARIRSNLEQRRQARDGLQKALRDE